MNKKPIKQGDVFEFKNYQEAYDFLIRNNDRCVEGCTLAIPASKGNVVNVIDTQNTGVTPPPKETESKKSKVFGTVHVRTTPTV